MEQYEYVTNLDGYDVYVSYASEGPTLEEAWALFEEAQSSMLYRHLATLGEEMEQ